MQSKPYRSSPPKSNLKLIATGGATKAAELRLGGRAPAEDMEPAAYLAKCESAWIEQRGKGKRAVLQYRLIDGKHDGVALRQWIPVCDGGNVISPTSKYAAQCAIALSRPLEEDDPFGDPAEIFAGKNFLVFIGYRKTDRPGGGGQASDNNAMHKKDDADRLKVHEITALEEW